MSYSVHYFSRNSNSTTLPTEGSTPLVTEGLAFYSAGVRGKQYPESITSIEQLQQAEKKLTGIKIYASFADALAQNANGIIGIYEKE